MGWVSDVTYLWTREGWLYLSATLDLYSPRVVSGSMIDRLDADLVMRSTQSTIASLSGDPFIIRIKAKNSICKKLCRPIGGVKFESKLY
jgi:hypothetical protein